MNADLGRKDSPDVRDDSEDHRLCIAEKKKAALEAAFRLLPRVEKTKAALEAAFVYNWCPGEDSNLHGVAPAST